MAAITTPGGAYHHELRQNIARLAQDEQPKSGVLVRETEYISGNDTADGSIHWKTGFMARFPWVGFVSWCVMLVCIAMSVVILRTSHTKLQDAWPAYPKYTWIKDSWKTKGQLTPSVALAITNTIANLALAVAIGQGVAIAWWRKVLKGSTVAELHNSWSFSTSAIDLLTAGKNFNIVALAALMAKLALVDNLLLQKAAGNKPAIGIREGYPIRVPLAQTLPADYGGVFSPDGLVGQLGFQFNRNVMQQALDGPFIDFQETDMVESTMFDTRCKGFCFGYVPAFGFNITCGETTTSHEYSVTPELAMNSTNAIRNNQFIDPDVVFSTLASFNAQQQLAGQKTSPNSSTPAPDISFISLTTKWATLTPATGPADATDATTCKGQILTRTCSLLPARVKYFVQVQQTDSEKSKASNNKPVGIRAIIDDTNPDIPDGVTNGQIMGYTVEETLPYDPKFDANIQALAYALQSLYGGQTRLEYLNGTGYVTNGVVAGDSSMSSWFSSLYGPRSRESCVVPDIGDPINYIMPLINTLTLRASLSQGVINYLGLSEAERKALVASQNSTQPFVADFTTQRQFDTIEYHSDWPFMIAAVVTMLFCAFCVLPSYWGFWQLGRKVTLGPVEIASAFQAPVLNDRAAASGGEVGILLKEMGERKVRYGEVEGTGRLGVANPEDVRKLSK